MKASDCLVANLYRTSTTVTQTTGALSITASRQQATGNDAPKNVWMLQIGDGT